MKARGNRVEPLAVHVGVVLSASTTSNFILVLICVQSIRKQLNHNFQFVPVSNLRKAFNTFKMISRTWDSLKKITLLSQKPTLFHVACIYPNCPEELHPCKLEEILIRNSCNIHSTIASIEHDNKTSKNDSELLSTKWSPTFYVHVSRFEQNIRLKYE